jgi:hypothetical protein
MNSNQTTVQHLPAVYRHELAVDRFGLKVAAQLSAGLSANSLEHDISERLRVARQQAIARRKKEIAPVFAPVHVSAGAVLAQGGSTAALSGMGHQDGDEPSLWTRIASFLPLLLLVAGLIGINVLQNDRRASELAEIDAALLTDDLPPSAYADPGFVQFLKAAQPPAER